MIQKRISNDSNLQNTKIAVCKIHKLDGFKIVSTRKSPASSVILPTNVLILKNRTSSVHSVQLLDSISQFNSSAFRIDSSSNCSSPITKVVSGFDLGARLLEAFSSIEFAGFCLTFFITLMYCVYRSYWREREIKRCIKIFR